MWIIGLVVGIISLLLHLLCVEKKIVGAHFTFRLEDLTDIWGQLLTFEHLIDCFLLVFIIVHLKKTVKMGLKSVLCNH